MNLKFESLESDQWGGFFRGKCFAEFPHEIKGLPFATENFTTCFTVSKQICYRNFTLGAFSLNLFWLKELHGFRAQAARHPLTRICYEYHTMIIIIIIIIK